jgi:hypothetical protein
VFDPFSAAAIVLGHFSGNFTTGHFSGNFTTVLNHAVKNSKGL